MMVRLSARTRFFLGLAVLGLLMTGPFILTAILAVSGLDASARQNFIEKVAPHLPLGGIVTALAFGLGAWLLHVLFRQYVNGLDAMSEELRLMLGANRAYRIACDATGQPAEVRALARAANDLAEQRDALLEDVNAQIIAAKAHVEEEKNRLAALMSELAMGVIVCTLEGRILLYNARARSQFQTLVPANTDAASTYIGLGRSILAVLERGQISHALEQIHRRREKGATSPTSHFVTATRGGQLLRVHMAPVRAADSSPAETTTTAHIQTPVLTPLAGYVLTIENITRTLERDLERDQLLHRLTDGNRAALGALRAAVEPLHDDPAMPDALRSRFIEVIRDEALRMSETLDEATHRFADALKTRWPLEDVLGVDILLAASKRIEAQLALPTKTEDIDDAIWIRAEGFSLILAMTFLAARLQEHYAIRELRFRLSRSEEAEGGKDMAFADLIWSGQPVSSETLYTWELEPLTIGEESSPLTLRDVIERHGGEIWYQREKAAHRAYFRLVLPIAATPELEPEARLPWHIQSVDARPEYYDFNLFRAPDASVDLDRKLSDLSYTIFDTETTGLEPGAGDEIIQIGATRIVNGRLLQHEVFDELIYPGMPVKPAGIPIHGITDDMLEGRPRIDTVLPRFHAFCTETVLVAHNAAFDMRFLEIKERSTGVRFSQPVLDTLLLSAVIHPAQESHRLEAIAGRLGVQILGRHTALGDALVTAEIFLRMMPLLADRGLCTLRDVLVAAEKTYYARLKY